MKTILLFLSFIALSNSYTNAFDEDVASAYDSYVEMFVKENQYYTIKVIQGIMNDEVHTGLYFRSVVGKEYNPMLIVDNKQYKLPSDSRGDVKCIALKNIDYDVIIINSDKIAQTSTPLVSVKKMSNFEFIEQNTIIIQGLNNGSRITNLTYDYNIGRIVFFVAASLVIVICTITIIIYFKKKKGIFSAEIRKAGVFDFKSFINEVMAEQQALKKNIQYSEFVYEDEVVQVEQGNYKNVYAYTKDIEEELSEFDIKGYLKDKGYNINYLAISESEKNQIMIELMVLKDAKKINNNDYSKEARELWKE